MPLPSCPLSHRARSDLAQQSSTFGWGKMRVACGDSSGDPVSHHPGNGDLGHHRMLCRDFYTYTFDSDNKPV